MVRRVFIFVWLVALLIAASLPASAGDILDRIVATVNGHIILQSDWDDAVRYEAFVAGQALSQVSAEDRKAALDRLIDQELLREQVRAADFQPVTDEKVNNRIKEIRKQYAGVSAWQAALLHYGLTESELKERVALQLNLMRLVDARLRPTVDIDSKSIESYYNQELLPQLRQSGEKEIALAEVTPKIKELLTQQKVNELLIAWLQNLRAGSDIRTEAASLDSGGQVR